MNGVKCELGTQYGYAGIRFTIADVIWIDGKLYHFNMYPIEVE